MEIEILTEESFFYTEQINNNICLRYKSGYLSKNFLHEPSFKKWLDGEKKKKDNVAKYKSLYKCKNCNCFLYKNYNEKIKCCNDPYYNYICEYCGSVFWGNSYCCLKKSIKGNCYLYILDGNYTCNIMQTDGFFECAKSLPLIFHVTFSIVILLILFLRRRGSNPKNIDSNFESKNTILSCIAFFLMLFTALIYSLTFFIPLSFVHLIYLFFFFKGYKTHLGK